MQSHYALAKADGRLYLDEGLTVRTMHKLYLERYEPAVAAALAQARQEHGDNDRDEAAPVPVVKEDFYRERFNRFDLAFQHPAVDSCSTCDELKIELATAADEDVAAEIRAKRHAHLAEADRAYAMRSHDRDLARASRDGEPDWKVPVEERATWDGTEFLCSDMAAVLQTPKVSTNEAFYLRKLRTFLYGLYSGQAQTHTLAFWDETIADKGSNACLSAAYQHFTVRNTGANALAWWVDNTSAQIKNKSGILFAEELTRVDGFNFFRRVDLRCSPPGHTFMENDRMFGVLSTKAKHSPMIASSKSWLRLATTIRNPGVHTLWMQQAFFRNFQTYLNALYTIPSKQFTNIDGDKVAIMKIRWFNFGIGEDDDGSLVAHPGVVWYRMSLKPDEPWKKIRLVERVDRAAAGSIDDPTYTLFTEPIQLEPAKVADLAKFRKWVPKKYHGLYPDPDRKREGEEDQESDDGGDIEERDEDQEMAGESQER